MEFKYQPRKRKDLKDLTDRVFAWKNSKKVKDRIEQQIECEQKILASMKLPWIMYLLMFITPFYFRRKYYENKSAKLSKEINAEVKIKQMNVYLRNELIYQESFKEIANEMEERFEDYLEYLEHIEQNAQTTDPIPYADVTKLLDTYDADPPANDIDKLSFYLTMESLLVRCQGGKMNVVK
jgi:hypothetical protein